MADRSDRRPGVAAASVTAPTASAATGATRFKAAVTKSTAARPGAAQPQAARPAAPQSAASPPDLRAVMLAVMAWAGGLAGFLLPHWLVLCLLAAAGASLAVRRQRGRRVLLGVAWLVAATAVAGSAMLRSQAITTSPVAELAGERAYVEALVEVTSDPVVRVGEFEPYTVLRARTVEVTGRGRTHHGRLPVLVIGDARWSEVELGASVVVEGRAAPADGQDLAAVVSTSRPPTMVREPGEVLDAAAAVRAGIRRAVSGADDGERTLVPALVVGDDQGMPADLVEAFRTAGLTHLLAVSGTNLTLVVGFLLVLARGVGVRAHGLVIVGVLGVAGFVLLARTEPSVVRAAAMGSVALLGMGAGGRERGVRALGVAVLVLLLLDPWLVMSLGFVLSALATAGILFLAPPWRDALNRWLPRWVAEAVAVPLAAQLACTPVVAAISGQVSLVAVLANMLVAAAVGPATVLGLMGGVTVLLVEPAGLLLGRAAGWCARWIIEVAEHSAALPTASVGWRADWAAVSLLSVLCLAVALAMPRLLTGRIRSLLAALLMVVAVARPLPAPGWPPDGWILVACDVGQGDGLVLNAGGGTAVVVDVGPDPAPIDRCLDRLEVERVSDVVLTHFHADHVGGLSGLLAERRADRVLVTALADPVAGAESVLAEAAGAAVPVRVVRVGDLGRSGSLSWQVVGPEAGFATGTAPSEGSPANNASVVLLVATRGVRILLTGDMEPEAQAALARSMPTLQVDVLKVPHHGSRYQDHSFLTGLRARLALVSVGADNEYGHPAAGTLSLLEEHGVLVKRTDESGDVAVVVNRGQLTVRELSTSSSAMR